VEYLSGTNIRSCTHVLDKAGKAIREQMLPPILPPRQSGRNKSFMTLTPELSHLFSPLLHEGLVLGDPEFLSVDDARSLRPRPVPVVRVLLHVHLRQSGLLLVVLLLVRVGHALPAGA